MVCHKIHWIGLIMTINKLSLLCFCALLLGASVTGCIASPASSSRQGQLAPLALHGIEPGMTLATVLRSLGSPDERKHLKGFIKVELKYPTIIIGFDELETVAFIESRSIKACLLTKICPGAPLEKMQQELEKHGYLSEVVDNILVINGDGCWGEVRLVKSRASSVRVQCPP